MINFSHLRNKPHIIGLICIVILTFCVSLGVYYLYVPRITVDWDEAENLLSGYKIYSSLRNMQWGELLRGITSQVYYPPLQSLSIGFTSLVSGFSVVNVRLINMFWLFISSITLYVFGSVIRVHKRGWIISFIATLLFLTSPMTLLFSSVALKELMGTALTLLALYTYLYMSETPTTKNYMMASLCWLLLFYTKYQYGVIVLCGLFVAQSLEFLRNNRAVHKTSVYYWITNCIGMALWIVPQGERIYARFVLGQLNFTVGIGSWIDHLVFYPRSIIYLFSANPLPGTLMVCSLLCIPLYIKNKPMMTLWLVTVVYVVFMTGYTINLHDRYVMTIIPFVYILFAYSFVTALSMLVKSTKSLLYIFLLSGFAYGVLVIRVPSYVYSVGAYTLRSPVFNQTDYKDLIFDYNVKHWPQKLPSGSYESPGDVVDFIVHNVDPSKDVVLVGVAKELSPKYIRLQLALSSLSERTDMIKQFSRFVVVIDILPYSRLYTRDYILFNRDQGIKDKYMYENKPQLHVINQKVFSEIGVAVNIFGEL
jgi:hypothetical protein